MNSKPKIFIASISASYFDPTVDAYSERQGIYICRLKENVESLAHQFVIVHAQRPLLFLWVTEDEARESALRFAKANLQEELGFANHAVLLTEIPRAMFVEAQVFMTLRELWSWCLRLTGFSRGLA